MATARTLSPSDTAQTTVLDRHACDEALADGFRPSSAAVALLFVVFAAWHAVDFPFDVAVVMVPLALLTAAVSGGAWLALGRRPLPAGGAHPRAAVLVALAYLNCLVQLALTGGTDLTVNVLLLVVALGVFLVDPRWVAGLTLSLAVTWPLALAAWAPGAAIATTVADLVAVLAVAAVANLLRRRTLARLLGAQARLREQSVRCDLTGLLNRRGFHDLAGRRLDAGEPVTLWFVDVDDLKLVNDRYGHDAGDLLLRDVAATLLEVFDDAVVARLSGDEFAVAEGDVTAQHLARRRRRLDGELAALPGWPGLPVHVSTGTARSRAGQSLADVIGAADAAMYARKSAWRAERSRASASA
jgi:diguanylate cyclase (GGDEF)-like protein